MSNTLPYNFSKRDKGVHKTAFLKLYFVIVHLPIFFSLFFDTEGSYNPIAQGWKKHNSRMETDSAQHCCLTTESKGITVPCTSPPEAGHRFARR